MHQLKKSACGLIEGKPVNTRVLNFRLVHAKPSAWLFRPARLYTCEISAVPNPDLEIKGGGSSSRPLDKGEGPVFKKNFFSTFRASVWSKNKRGGEGRPGPSPGSATEVKEKFHRP